MALTLILKMSSSTDSLTSATQIVVKYDKVDGDDGKLVEKLSKVEKAQKPKKLQRSSVRRNIYQSIGFLSTIYKELKLLLEL